MEESDRKQKKHWWTLGLKGEKKRWRGCRGEESVRRDAPSDRQRDKAVVLLDVAFEDV